MMLGQSLEKRKLEQVQESLEEGKRLISERMKEIQSLILSGKNILQELLSRELTTMRHVSFIQNFR